MSVHVVENGSASWRSGDSLGAGGVPWGRPHPDGN